MEFKWLMTKLIHYIVFGKKYECCVIATTNRYIKNKKGNKKWTSTDYLFDVDIGTDVHVVFVQSHIRSYKMADIWADI